MTTIVERYIEFEFNRRWRIQKYDSHTYYLGMSGLNMKAVDLVGVKDGNMVYLIEVKNFVDMPASQIARTKEKLEGNPCELVLNFQAKISNTIKGIAIIETYLKRKPILRFWMRWLMRWKAGYSWMTFLPDRVFWLFVAQLIQQRQVVLALYILLPKELESYRTSIREALHTQMPNYVTRILPFFDELEDVIITRQASLSQV